MRTYCSCHITTFQPGVEAYLDLCEQPGNPMP